MQQHSTSRDLQVLLVAGGKKRHRTQTWINCLGLAARIQCQQVVKRLGNLHHQRQFVHEA